MKNERELLRVVVTVGDPEFVEVDEPNTGRPMRTRVRSLRVVATHKVGAATADIDVDCDLLDAHGESEVFLLQDAIPGIETAVREIVRRVRL